MKKIRGTDPETFEIIYYDIYEKGDWIQLVSNDNINISLSIYEVTRDQNSPRLFINVNGEEAYVFDWRVEPIKRQGELFPEEKHSPWKYCPGLL